MLEGTLEVPAPAEDSEAKGFWRLLRVRLGHAMSTYV
jgi:hypothetical protein